MALKGDCLILICSLTLAGCGRTPGWTPAGDGSAPGADASSPLITWLKFYDQERSAGGGLRAGDCAGNSYLGGGWTGETFPLGKTRHKTRGATDLFVARLDPRGNFLWTLSNGGPGHDYITQIEAAADGSAYVAGKLQAGAKLGVLKLPKISGEHTMFVARVSAQGKFLWATLYGGGAKTEYMSISGLHLGKGGTVLISGKYSGTPTVGGTTLPTRNGPFYGYIVRLTAGGAVSWVKAIPTTEEVRTGDITADASGNVYVSGYFSGRATFGATRLSSSKDPKKLKTSDAFLTKLDPKGNFLWARQGGGEHDDSGAELAPHPSGDIIMGGKFMARATFGSRTLTARGAAGTLEPDVFVARYSSSGSLKWITQIGRAQSDTLNSLAVDKAGNILFAARATLQGGEAKQSSALFGQLDATGAVRWLSWTGSAGPPWKPGQTSASLSLNNCTGHIYAAGYVTGTAAIWPFKTTLTSERHKDGNWYAKLDQGWVCRLKPPCHTATLSGGRCLATVMKDGTTCTDGAQSGVCLSGRCCTGCLGQGTWPLCMAGDGVSQCGSGGKRCDQCGGGCSEHCNAGKCKTGGAPDGAWCTGGTFSKTYGKCAKGKCCDGCVAGGVCYEGSSDKRCGFFGAACETCGPGTRCSKSQGCVRQ